MIDIGGPACSGARAGSVVWAHVVVVGGAHRDPCFMAVGGVLFPFRLWVYFVDLFLFPRSSANPL